MDLTTNRVDAMNHYGVAREASAIYNVELKKVEPKLPQPNGAGNFPIVIEDAQGCARYTARIVRNVKVGPSPQPIAKRLEMLGSRPINNAADATNYALNELGHPTHVFDLDLLEGGTIIVQQPVYICLCGEPVVIKDTSAGQRADGDRQQLLVSLGLAAAHRKANRVSTIADSLATLTEDRKSTRPELSHL